MLRSTCRITSLFFALSFVFLAYLVSNTALADFRFDADLVDATYYVGPLNNAPYLPYAPFVTGSSADEACATYVDAEQAFLDVLETGQTKSLVGITVYPAPWTPYFLWESYGVPTVFMYGKCQTQVISPNVPDPTYGSQYIYVAMGLYQELGQKGACVGNPCNPGSGNKFQQDIDIDGSGAALGLVRSYNSLKKTDVGFGVGWTSSAHMRLELQDSITVARRSDGSAEPFGCSGTGVCESDPDAKSLLNQDASGYTLQRWDGSQERYDLSGKLIESIDKAGTVTAYNYGTDGKLDTITGPYGHSLTFAYHPDGHVASVTDELSNAVSYSYDSNANLTRVDFLDNTARQYHYEDEALPNHLTGISLIEADNSTQRYATYSYHPYTGYAKSTEHAQTTNTVGQERFTLSYDGSAGFQTTVSDAEGNQEQYYFSQFSGDRKLFYKLNKVDNKSISNEYYDIGNLKSHTDEAGRRTTYLYTATNQLRAITEAVGTPQTRTTTYEYLSPDLDLVRFVRHPSIVTGQTAVTEVKYNDPNHPTLPTAIIQSGFKPDGTAVSRTINMTYNANGQVFTIDGPRTDVSDITRLDYYVCTTGGACGQLKSVTNALGHVTTYDAYYTDGRPKQSTGPNGLVTAYTYDVKGRLETVTQTPPVGDTTPIQMTRYTYTAFDAVASITAPDDTTISYTYDAAQDLRSVTNGQGNRIEYRYDARGNRVSEQFFNIIDSNTRTRSWAYDLRNRLRTSNLAGNVTTLVTDAVGNLVSTIDPNNNDDGTLDATTHTPDALSRLTKTVDLLNGITDYSYDVHDNLTSVKFPNGATTEYVYDDLGNLLQETSPDRGILIYTYDEAGNRLSTRDAKGQSFSYSYDALNRPIGNDAPGTDQDASYTYDSCAYGKGRLCRVTLGTEVADYAYDAFGNITQHQGIVYTYDAANRIKTMTYPSGAFVTYGYNAAGRAYSVQLIWRGITYLASGVSYQPFGPMFGMDYGNGLDLRQGLDAAYRYTSHSVMAWGGSLSFPQLDLHSGLYDDNGNLLERRDELNIIGHWGFGTNYRYSYDDLNRLDTAAHNNTNFDFDYGANGNRTHRLKGTASTSYVYETNSNRLDSAGADDMVLDANGNTTTSGPWTYNYTVHNRLASAVRSGYTYGSYSYNGLGQRTQKRGPYGDYDYRYGLNGELLAETTVAGTPVSEYIYLNGRPLAMIQDGFDLYYIHNDHLGTPHSMSDVGGRLVWRAEYDPYGRATVNPDVDQDGWQVRLNLRFPGQYYDRESKLHYNWHRYYDPALGRYVTSDPIGLLGGLNTYAYVESNPLRYSDVTGLQVDNTTKAINTAFCASLEKKIRNVQKRIGRRRGQLQENPGELSEAVEGDDKKPSLSRRGHRRLINEDKALLAKLKALYLARCSQNCPPTGSLPGEHFSVEGMMSDLMDGSPVGLPPIPSVPEIPKIPGMPDPTEIPFEPIILN